MINPRRMRILGILLAIVLYASGACAALSTSDSIRRAIPKMSPADRLTAYSNLCRLASSESDEKYEQRCITDFINEAHRQGDYDKEGLARSMQLNCYYNYDRDKQIAEALPAHLAFMAKHQLWDYYYNSWNILIESDLYLDKTQTALLEAQKMYADAHARKLNYGLGVSAYSLGNIYQTMQRYPEAVRSLQESVAKLSKEEDITLLLTAYNALGESLDAIHRYDQLRTVAAQWRAVIDKYKRKAEAQGMTPSLNGRYLYCTLAAAVAELETKHYDKALPLINQARVLAEGRKTIAQFKLLQVEARYYTAIGDYKRAIACNEANMKIIIDAGDSISLLTVEESQAGLLLKVGRPVEAALLYKKVMEKKDALRDNQLTSQLDELRTIYDVDKLQFEKRIISVRFYFAISCTLLLLIVVVLYIRYAHRLHKKNTALYDTIQELHRMQDHIDTTKDSIPETELSSDEILYRKLCKLVVEEQLFKDAQIGRKELADRLGTNRTYLADAVKKCADGATVSDFLNNYRLRHAANLLTNHIELSVIAVGEESGFNSRSTYHRLFREQFGMSPSEYRSISRQKRQQQGKSVADPD
jgi:AraC-like DNA-binding protein